MLLIGAEPMPVVDGGPSVEVVLRLSDTHDRPHSLRVSGDPERLRAIARSLIGAADTADAAARAIERVEGQGGDLE